MVSEPWGYYSWFGSENQTSMTIMVKFGWILHGATRCYRIVAKCYRIIAGCYNISLFCYRIEPVTILRVIKEI